MVRQRDARGGVVNEQTLSRAQLAGFIKSLRAKNQDVSVLIGGKQRALRIGAAGDGRAAQAGRQKVGLQVKTTQQ